MDKLIDAPVNPMGRCNITSKYMLFGITINTNGDQLFLGASPSVVAVDGRSWINCLVIFHVHGGEGNLVLREVLLHYPINDFLHFNQGKG